MMVLWLMMGLSLHVNADTTTLQGAKKACNSGDAKGCGVLGVMRPFKK